MKKIIIAVILIILVAIGATYKILTMPVSNNTEEKEVEIPMGSGSAEIATILKENNIIRSKLIFRLYIKTNKISNFQAGTYYLRENMNLKEITEMLQTGIMHDPNQLTITYLEGKPMWWLAKTIAKETNNTEDDVYNLLEDEAYIDEIIEEYWFLTDEIKNEDIYYPLEGYLFPDTYAIANKDTSVKDIFKKMLDKMETILKDYKEEIEESNYTIHEILALASIVETEGASSEDRKDLASVCYNRLDRNMSLGSDVTTYYAVKEDMGDRELYQKEIDAYNPYNTRGPNMEGKLPVGPICSLGRESIEAAIRPSDTDYLFYAVDKNGKIYFTKTNSEHVQVINRLQNNGEWYEFD